MNRIWLSTVLLIWNFSVAAAFLGISHPICSSSSTGQLGGLPPTVNVLSSGDDSGNGIDQGNSLLPILFAKSRREWIISSARTACGLVLPSLVIGLGQVDEVKAAENVSKLQGRFLNEQAILTKPGGAGFGDSKQLFLPSWILGTWSVTAIFEGAQYPLGVKYLPGKFRTGNIRSPGSPPGSAVTYLQRYFSTLPDTPQNQLKVTLGQVPKSEVTPDIAFNTRELLNAYAGFPAVEGVEYDARTDPLKVLVRFSPVGPDFQPLPPGRMEVYINRLQAEAAAAAAPAAGGAAGGGPAAEGAPTYYTSEVRRSVTIAGRTVEATDAESLTEYVLQPDGTINGRQRIACYLAPNPNNAEGAMFMEVGNKAVAIYNYSFQMKEIGGGCVQTPKGYTQCK